MIGEEEKRGEWWEKSKEQEKVRKKETDKKLPSARKPQFPDQKTKSS